MENLGNAFGAVQKLEMKLGGKALIFILSGKIVQENMDESSQNLVGVLVSNSLQILCNDDGFSSLSLPCLSKN